MMVSMEKSVSNLVDLLEAEDNGVVLDMVDSLADGG